MLKYFNNSVCYLILFPAPPVSLQEKAEWLSVTWEEYPRCIIFMQRCVLTLLFPVGTNEIMNFLDPRKRNTTLYPCWHIYSRRMNMAGSGRNKYTPALSIVVPQNFERPDTPIRTTFLSFVCSLLFWLLCFENIPSPQPAKERHAFKNACANHRSVLSLHSFLERGQVWTFSPRLFLR